MSEARIGTSGWSYKEWVGAFYPNSVTNKLSFYTKLYKTVEVDSTFYAYPSKGLVMGWSKYSPEGFVFSVKLPQLLTHEKKLDLAKGVEADLVRFLSLMRPLIASGKLGPVLIQLPPSYSYQSDFEALKRFLNATPEDVRFAVEFRHPTWLREDVWSFLKAKNVANVIVDEPLLPPDTVVTADFSYIRWHGRGSRPWYNYRYTEKELEGWVPKVREVVSKTKETFGYFNNHFRGFAVENSIRMMQMMGKSSPLMDEAKTRATAFIDGDGRPPGETSILEFLGEGAS
jgi:uncharacterized protein YecE (DUF72 family)